jgi:hypothetical protein
VVITGLARSGTTLLLEYLAAHERVATHRYRDYPLIYTPWWWNWFLDRASRRPAQPVERAHRDGIRITPESPEAVEEMIWMAFFDHLHVSSQSDVLDTATDCPAFERFLRDHIRKLLFLRGGGRYVSKNNYSLTRLGFLVKLFPDARFVVPVREPAAHIASLIKQHELFCRAERRHPRARAYLRRLGHYEFGLDRRPVNAGDRAAVETVLQLWERGDEARGWARYWASVHDHAARCLDTGEAVARATMIVRFEDLCERPAETLRAVSVHCGLAIDNAAFETFAAAVRYPSYYRPDFSHRELDTIRVETAEAAARFGYRS